MMTMPSRKGFIIYQGPSRLDGQPIVVIALMSSTNRKTGPMLQTYILRSDVDPIEAVHRGADVSICGDCRHRGNGDGTGRSCYVVLMHGPRQVYKAYRAGRYAAMTAPADISGIGAGRAVRIGTYGDPAAVPTCVFAALTQRAAMWTGYTHQWRRRPSLRPFAMASVDSPAEAQEAQAKGWRTFRVRTVEQRIAANEVTCPASREAGYRTQCIRCGLCQGTRSGARRSIVIAAHGTGASHFQEKAQ